MTPRWPRDLTKSCGSRTYLWEASSPSSSCWSSWLCASTSRFPAA
uniref:Uncharacterized protein n=1 Tax=Oryzias latipes TaxID=8090 RepID=A0A3B3HJX4_ORYLA